MSNLSNFKSGFLNELNIRGFIHQCTDIENLDKLMAEAEEKGAGISAYIGFDCTAKSLHVGNLVSVMVLKLLHKYGHNPIILLGGATTKIGDPSGKDESRPPLSDEQIEANKQGIAKNFSQFGLSKARFVDNLEWLEGMDFIKFLREIGPLFSVNRMLTQDSVKLRLEREQSLSFLEFNYMIMQAYDFVELAKRHNCHVQIGGSDQWGNIVMGVDLGRRLIKQGLFGLTTPLITTSDGKKMGKTAAGAVWLSGDMLSSYDYWQFWRNTADQDVGRFLRLFTELDIAEIEKLERLEGSDINEAKIVLANEATRLCHGENAAKEAAETAEKTFAGGEFGDSLSVVEIPESELAKGIEAFVILERTGLVDSKSEARRLIKNKGGRVNNKTFDSEKQLVTLADTNSDGLIKLSAGKKKHLMVKAS